MSIPMSTPVAQFPIGARVSATLYGQLREGTVTRHGTTILYVLFDGSVRPRFIFPKSLTLVGQS